MKSTLNVSNQLVHIITALFLVASIWSGANAAHSAPVQQYEGFVSSPRANAVVRGIVSIDGTANHPQFLKYEVRLAAGLNPNVSDSQWIRLRISEAPVVNGQLAVWDTSAVPDGAYIMRLRVVRADSNYQDFDVAPVNVANAAPPTVAPSPTPAESATPTITPTSFVPGATITPFGTPAAGGTVVAPEGTPATVATLAPSGTLPPSEGPSPTPILIDQPTIIVSTSTPDPDAVAVVPAATRDPDDGDGNPLGIPGFPTDIPAIRTETITQPLMYGIIATASIFLLIGLLYVVRALFRAARR